MQPIFDAEFARGAARAMAKNPQITAEQMEQGRVMVQKIGGVVDHHRRADQHRPHRRDASGSSGKIFGAGGIDRRRDGHRDLRLVPARSSA